MIITVWWICAWMHRRQTNCSMKEDNLRITPAFPAASVSPTLPSLSPSALALVARPLSVVAVLPAVFGFLPAVCVLPPLSLQTPPPFPGVKHSLAWISTYKLIWYVQVSLSLTHSHTHTTPEKTWHQKIKLTARCNSWRKCPWLSKTTLSQIFPDHTVM